MKKERKFAKDMRDRLKSDDALREALANKIFEGDCNAYLEDDVRWRAYHLQLDLEYWEVVKSDLPWLLSDGSLIMKSAAATKPEPNLFLRKQTLQEHWAYKDSYLVRDSFRCFHRGDGTRNT